MLEWTKKKIKHRLFFYLERGGSSTVTALISINHYHTVRSSRVQRIPLPVPGQNKPHCPFSSLTSQKHWKKNQINIFEFLAIFEKKYCLLLPDLLFLSFQFFADLTGYERNGGLALNHSFTASCQRRESD